MPKVHPHQVSFRAMLLLLAGGLVLGGCVGAPPPQSEAPIKDSSRNAGIAFHLALLSLGCFECVGRWPNSLDELRLLDCTNDEAERQLIISNEWTNVPWSELEHKVTLNAMPDGKLSIFVPYLGPSINEASSATSDGAFKVTLREARLTIKDVELISTNETVLSTGWTLTATNGDVTETLDVPTQTSNSGPSATR
jgi:hypothetical protein